MRVMISCGEPSGDLYAALLAQELVRAEPGAFITGFGGERLRAAGVRLVGDFAGLSVTGLIEVARVLPRTYATYRRLVGEARQHRPDVLVAVDFPDFNFRLAQAVRRLGVPVVYYVSPQLWAWRPGRMKTMQRIADKVLVIFPFEEQIYRQAGVPVEWVGHPLLDAMQTLEPRHQLRSRLGVPADGRLIALLPGSRANEVREILPDLVAAADIVRNRVPNTQVVVARAPHLEGTLFHVLARVTGSPPLLIEGQTDAVLGAADVALMASGTVTVQAALHECPMVVVYRLSPLTYRLGKPFVRVDTFAMANLVAGRRVVPELIQDAFTPEAVAREALRILEDPSRAARMRNELRAVRETLGSPGASARAARAVLETARTVARRLR